ncbi:MAG: RsiV family protein [Paramuribaculum sp.]|nr:RsiV family protein [Paramuribaculum sp.]
MNIRLFRLQACAATSLLLISACQGTAIDNSVSPSSSEKSDDSGDSIIASFPLSETIMSASETYRLTDPADSSSVRFITLSTSVQWPEALGKFKIDNLHDSIVGITFGADAPKDIKKAIRQSVTRLDSYGLDGQVEKTDTIPASEEQSQYYVTRTLQLIECTQETVTYSSTFSEYLGGAHPNSGATPFSFILASDRPVTFDFLFLPGAMETLKPMILESIAASKSLSVDELKQALLNSPDSITNNVYILNGTIAFHYNPYEILPYSYGPSEAFIIPDDVISILTPEAIKLLID